MEGHFWEVSIFKGPKKGTPEKIFFFFGFMLVNELDRKSQHKTF